MTLRKLFIVAVILGIPVFLYGVHFYIGHPDRYAAAKRRDQLTKVEAQILHYESDHDQLPATLDELVKNSYLRDDEVNGANGPVYIYDPVNRRLTEAEGSYIHGLMPYRMKPFGMAIPGTNAPAKPAIPPTPIPVVAQQQPEQPLVPAVTPVKPVVVNTNVPETTPATSAPATPAPPATPPEVKVAARITPLTLQGPELADPPVGALVFEAENFTETNYGWEAHVDPKAGGGAYLHTKEGVANGPAQLRYNVGNFYDVHAKADLTFLRYHFYIPADATYYCYGRMWTTDTHCSNHLCLDFDNETREGGIDNRTPFRWLWTQIKDSPHRFTKGDHYINIFIHEDGIRLDQFIFSPTPIAEDHDAFKANFIPGHNTQWEAKDGPPAHLSIDLANATISPELPPNAKIVLRRLRNSTGIATLKVVLKNAGKDGGDFPVLDAEVDLATLAELNFIPLSFEGLDLAKLARREYVLQADLLRDGKNLAAFNVVLSKPWAWEVFGPGKYLMQGVHGPLDGDGTPKAGDSRVWTAFKDSSYDWFGVLDFGVQFGNNSKHAPQNCTVYARTTITVPAGGNYLFKVMADDQMMLWLDGEEIYRIDDVLPVTRSARSFTHELTAGEHRIRMRINQTEGPWQAFLRIRTIEDETSDIVGK